MNLEHGAGEFFFVISDKMEISTKLTIVPMVVINTRRVKPFSSNSAHNIASGG
jgi:hypothetical protein